MKCNAHLYKIVAILIWNCFGFLHVNGQCVPDNFMKHYMGNAAVYTSKLITTPQNDIVVTGAVLKINGDFLDATDGWVTKLSPRGNVLWAKRYFIPGFNSGGFYSVENATDSSYFITGRFGKYIKRQFGSWEEIDAASFLLHLDKFGNLIWSKRITQYINDSYLSSITKLQDGNFLIGGTIFNSAGSKLLLLNIDLSANVKWDKLIFSDSTFFAGPTVKQLNNGTLVLAGFTQKNGPNYSSFYDQGYYFTKFDATTGEVLSTKGIYINTNSVDLPTGHDNIKKIIELNNDTLVLCSSFSGDRLFGATPGTKEALLVKISPTGLPYKADGFLNVNTRPGFRLADAQLKDGRMQLLLDDGYNTFFAEVSESGQVVNQRAYGNVYSLLKGYRFLDGNPDNRIYYDGRGQYPLMGLMKTEDDASIPCMESQSQIIRKDVSSFFRNGSINLIYMNVSFPFAFEEFGGIGRADYFFQTTIDCMASCCDNIRSDTTRKEFCNTSSFRLPDNSLVRETGMYYINVKNANGCDSVSYFNVKFNFNPVVELGADTCLTDQQPIRLTVDSGYANYNWMGVNNSSHTYTITRPGTYKVTVTNGCGATTDQIEVFKECEFPVYMPTAFTPNNDGLNDTYKYPSLNKHLFVSLKIYNRYGQEVFNSHDIRKGWSGKFKGIDQPIGGYVYLLKTRTLDGKENLKKGSISLIR